MSTDNHSSIPQKIWSFLKSILLFIKKRWYHIILLALSTGYLLRNHFKIEKLDDFSLISTVFIIWVVLLLLPLFSELEFLGVKIKKEVQQEVEKSNEEIKRNIRDIQAQITQLQISNNIANQVTVNGGPLPSETKIDELIAEVHALSEANKDKKETDTAEKTAPEQSIKLFEMRLGIETALKDICEKYGIVGKFPMTVVQMASYLRKEEILDSNIAELLIQVVKITNRGVHGEIVNQKYMDFASQAYPQIMKELIELQNECKTGKMRKVNLMDFEYYSS